MPVRGGKGGTMGAEKILNIGLLGYGHMGRTHAYCLSVLPFYAPSVAQHARLYGLCTAHPDSARTAAAGLGGVRVYDRPEDMIRDPDIDIVDICTPNVFHYDALRAAVQSGKHIYCEKPLCFDLKEADTVAGETSFPVYGRTCGIVFHNRFFPAVRLAKRYLEEGRLGRILQFRFDYLHNSCIFPDKPAGWKQDATVCGGGVLFDLGSHMLDLLTYLLGPLDSLFAKEQIAFPVRTGRDGQTWTVNADEASYLLITLKNKAVGTLTVSKISSGTEDDLSFAIYGEKGALRWSLTDMDYLEFAEETSPNSYHGFVRIAVNGRYAGTDPDFPSAKAPAGWLRAHVGCYTAFLNAVLGGRAACPSFAQGAYVQYLMDRAQESARAGREVSLEREAPEWI